MTEMTVNVEAIGHEKVLLFARISDAISRFLCFAYYESPPVDGFCPLPRPAWWVYDNFCLFPPDVAGRIIFPRGDK